MPRPNLRRTAAEQARAEYNPQIRGVRREAQGQVRSIRSAGPALEASLQRSGQQLRRAGLDQDDLAIALRELANRTADVGASTALQTQQVRQEAQGEIVDLQAARGQAQNAALASLQQAAAERAQEIQDAEAADVRGLKMDILKEEALKKLGLGSYADDGAEGGLTPTQRRAEADEHDNAAFYAKQYFKAIKDMGGITDEETGEVIFGPDPKQWDDKAWNYVVEKVASKEGVSDIKAAQRATQAIRDHVQPSSDASAGSLLQSLGLVASTAAQVGAPEPLRPLAQFGSALLRRR